MRSSLSAQIVTADGNKFETTTRDVNASGVGFIHREQIPPGTVSVTVFAGTQPVDYQIYLEWCRPCGNGLFMSGGRFLKQPFAGAVNSIH